MKVLLEFLAIFALCVQSASTIENDPIPGAVIAVQTFGDGDRFEICPQSIHTATSW
jgi:hypothetical protein